MRIVSLGLISLLFLWACGSSDRKSEEQDFMQALDSKHQDAATLSGLLPYLAKASAVGLVLSLRRGTPNARVACPVPPK